jgi:two-component system KDP operon response regulator KdpE
MSERTKQVLLIDDEAPIHRFIVASLTAQQFQVAEAQTGKDGLIKAAQVSPDIILLDLGLPDVDGVNLIGPLREQSNAPIIVISARGVTFDRIAALDAGASDFLAKPFTVEELREHIRNVLSGNSEHDESSDLRMTLGDLTIDLVHNHVQRSGVDIPLSPLESKLMKILIRHRGRLLSTHFLAKELWGADHTTRGIELRVLMNSLRRKLEPDPIRPRYLFAEAGVGYRLAVQPARSR